jgi:hypothetical protein
MRTAAVGVVLPVHDEEELLGRCHRHLALVLDRCSDRSAAIAGRWCREMRAAHARFGVSLLEFDAANVGAARRAGAAEVLAALAAFDPRRIWLATTDADSEVPPDWLATQVSMHEKGVDLWTGSVTVLDWSHRDEATARAWRELYDEEVAPTHGTSFGVNAAAYLEAGGFDTVPTGEDRALHQAVRATGVRVLHDESVPVVTSSRRDARAPGGFAHALSAIERRPAGRTPR